MNIELQKLPAATTIRRTLVFPVVDVIGATWKEFDAALRFCLDESTKAANIIASGMYAQDAPAPQAPRGEKLKLGKFKFDGKPVYARVREAVPGLPTGTLAAIMRRVRGSYMARRFDVMGRHAASLSTFRWPYPFHLRKDAFTLGKFKGENGKEHWRITFALGSREADDSRGRFTLRLRSGSEMWRQMRSLEHAVSIDAASVTRRQTGDGVRTIVNLCVTLPRSDREQKTGLMRVILGGGSFARFADDCWLKPYHADHVRGWIVAHDARRQRLADDSKYEKRWPKRARARMTEKLAAICAANNNRIDTFVEQFAAMVVGFCVRRRFAGVVLDSTDRSFVGHFPWFKLAEKIRQKCEANAIDFSEIEPNETTAPAEPKRADGPGDVAPAAGPETDPGNGNRG